MAFISHCLLVGKQNESYWGGGGGGWMENFVLLCMSICDIHVLHVHNPESRECYLPKVGSHGS